MFTSMRLFNRISNKRLRETHICAYFALNIQESWIIPFDLSTIKNYSTWAAVCILFFGPGSICFNNITIMMYKQNEGLLVHPLEMRKQVLFS